MVILIADDDSSTRKGLRLFLETEGHVVQDAADGQIAAEILERESFDLLLSDVKMPHMDGLALLAQVREHHADLPVLMMTAYATVEEAVKALQNGAMDYLTKPLNLNELAIKLERLTERLVLSRENAVLKDRLRHFEFPDMIGVSEAIRQAQEAISRLSSDSDVPVMIYGESGTGKELVARTLHSFSQRKDQAFLAVNCAAFQDTLLESELFGHKKGAFTGAYRDKAGFFQEAHGGTLFLDEVGEMSSQMQSKLLRTLQEQQVTPVGDTHPRAIDVRLIGASNRNLDELVEEAMFRQDLYYRLNVVEICVPPLRDRREDIALLVAHFVEKYQKDRPAPELSLPFLEVLKNHKWPGNVRELENLVRMLLATSRKALLRPEDLPEKFLQNRQSGGEQVSWLENQNFKAASNLAVATFEKQYIRFHLARCSGNVSQTAQSIGLSRVALHQKIKKYGISNGSI